MPHCQDYCARPMFQKQSCCSPQPNYYSSGQHSPRQYYCPHQCSPKYGSMRLHAGADSPYKRSEDDLAAQMVSGLVQSCLVFRNFARPMGGVMSDPGTIYSIRGFFLELGDGSYQFSPPSPLMQIWSTNKEPLEIPAVLDSAPFTAVYRNAQHVVHEGQLTLHPRGVVINCP